LNDLIHHRGHRVHREKSNTGLNSAFLSDLCVRKVLLSCRFCESSVLSVTSVVKTSCSPPPGKHSPEHPCLLFRDKQPAFLANAGLFVFCGQEFSGIAAEKVPESCHRGEPVVSLESPNPSIQMLIASSHTDRDAPTNRFSETNHAQRIRSPV
jgi:hypothetical protein